MPDMTRSFMNHPANFLGSVPLIVSVFPGQDFGQQAVHLRIDTSDDTRNSVRSVLDTRPCELTIDRDHSSPLTAYWCPFRADTATLLTLHENANFMFTDNMNGCTLVTNGSGRATHLVSHSNAATFGAIIHEYTESTGETRLAQQEMQTHMAAAALGTQAITAHHSFSGSCTTVVGVRDVGSGSWAFYEQVNSVSNDGVFVTVQSLARL